VHQEFATEEKIDIKRVQELRDKYSRYFYFILSLSKHNKEALTPEFNHGSYGDLVNTMSFRMNEFVNLTTSLQDTIPVADFMLNRSYGMGATTDVMLVFSREKSKGSKWVKFNIDEFGLGVGNLEFVFETSDLHTEPRICFTGPPI